MFCIVLVQCRLIEYQYDVKDDIGYQLANKYCTSCHIYTPPGLLDRASWMRVLPVMKDHLAMANIEVEQNEWAEIRQFYYYSSPQWLGQLPIDSNDLTRYDQELSVVLSNEDVNREITMLECDSINQLLYVGNQNGDIEIFDGEHVVDKMTVSNTPIGMQVMDAGLAILSMGHLGPTNESIGILNFIDQNLKTEILADSLSRPSHMSYGDVNGDGLEDFVISSFGSVDSFPYTGGISLLLKNGDTYEEEILSIVTGPVKTIIKDMNKDGLNDIVALYSQGREQVVLYTQLPGGEFKAKSLLEFHPLYGCLDMEFFDYDDDGVEELILANGDNADYSQIVKPYHGLRVFKLNEEDEYEEDLFFHINGASVINISDFDLDGEPEIIVLSAYPDLFSRKWEAINIFKKDRRGNWSRGYLDYSDAGSWLLCEPCLINNTDALFLSTNRQINRRVPPQIADEWSKNKIGVGAYNFE